MKIKNGFAKRNIAGANIVVPVGDMSKNFNGMITLNESASFFWDLFSKKDITVDEAVKAVTDNYDVDENKAREDILKFLEMLKENELIED